MEMHPHPTPSVMRPLCRKMLKIEDHIVSDIVPDRRAGPVPAEGLLCRAAGGGLTAR